MKFLKENELEKRHRKHKKTIKPGAMGSFIHPDGGNQIAIDTFNNSVNMDVVSNPGLGEDLNENYSEDKLRKLISVQHFISPKDHIQLFTTERGNYLVKRNGKKMMILDKKNFSESEIEDLRLNGYFNDYDQIRINEGMSKLEMMKLNKQRYADLEKEIDQMPDGLEKDIYKLLGLRWIKGRNWEGGLGNGKDIDRLYQKIMDKYNVSFEEVHDIFTAKFIDPENWMYEDFNQWAYEHDSSGNYIHGDINDDEYNKLWDKYQLEKELELEEDKEILYIIKDRQGRQLSRPTPDDNELWDRVDSMDPYGKKGYRVVVYTGESLSEDTIKQNGKWVNKGKEGTHGKFNSKKKADAQRKAMFANGYKMTNKEIKEALNKLDMWAIDNDTTFYDLKTLYEAFVNPNSPVDQKKKEKIQKALNDPTLNKDKEKLQDYISGVLARQEESLEEHFSKLQESAKNIIVPKPYNKYFEVDTINTSEDDDYKYGDKIDGYDCHFLAYLIPKDEDGEVYPILTDDPDYPVCELVGGRLIPVDLQ